MFYECYPDCWKWSNFLWGLVTLEERKAAKTITHVVLWSFWEERDDSVNWILSNNMFLRFYFLDHRTF